MLHCIKLQNLILINARPSANKPKPNTRFLRNIIKDTDSHNAALLAKEAADSRARLQSLAGNKHREEKASRVGGGDIRRRQLGDIAAILGGGSSKRRRIEDTKRTEKSRQEGRRVNTSSEDEGSESNNRNHKSGKARNEEAKKPSRYNDLRSRHRDESKERGKAHYRRHRDTSEERSRRKEHRRRKSRSRSHSPRYRSKEARHRHRSPLRKRERSPEHEKERSHRSHKHQRPLSDQEDESKPSKRPVKEDSKPDYDSDPLDEIIGPRPPPIPEVRSRGRGTMSLGSGIDSRFSASYDPTVDVQLDPDEENDWDQALEALRDRQKWKQQGADRLRAAGFTEEEITKWEKGGEKREEDVKWAKKGEGREWDRGKVVDEEGIVKVEPSWGRLKGT